jgi:thiamine biosynthesis lipoprotein
MNLYKAKFRAMGGGGEITLAAPDQVHAEHAISAATDEIARIESKYSRYRDDSIVGKINASAGTGQWIDIDEETQFLIDHAQNLYQISDGAFDITSGILRNAWKFDSGQLPSPDQITALRAAIGWTQVKQSDKRLQLSVGTEIDFGGFGKEYAADRAAETLAATGCLNGMVNLGGDIRIIGPQPNGEPWIIGIQDPRNPDQLLASIPMSQGALATSGDYERFFELDGKRYCHILNPKTGYPVSHWRSVSVIAPNALTAGSTATIAMLKELAAIPFLQQSGFKFLAVDQHKSIFRN